MKTRLGATALVANILIGSAIGDAAAQGSPRWLSRTTEHGTAMMFAAPNSDHIALSFECNNARGEISLTVFDELKDTAEGEPVRITLAAGGQMLTADATAVMNGLFGYVVAEAASVPPSTLVSLLRAKGPLSVSVGSTTIRYTERGRSAAASSFAAGCQAK